MEDVSVGVSEVVVIAEIPMAEKSAQNLPFLGNSLQAILNSIGHGG